MKCAQIAWVIFQYVNTDKVWKQSWAGSWKKGGSGGEPWVGETCQLYRHELNTSCRFWTFHITGIFQRKNITSEMQHSLKQDMFQVSFLACYRRPHTFKSLLLPAPISTVFHHPLTLSSSSAHTLGRCPSLVTPYLLLHLWPLPAPLSPPAWVSPPACLLACLPACLRQWQITFQPLHCFASEINRNDYLEVSQ